MKLALSKKNLSRVRLDGARKIKFNPASLKMRLSCINNESYTDSEYVSEFIHFLGKIISNERNIFCDYTPKKDKQNQFTITSFKEGLERYTWGGKSFKDTQHTVSHLSKKLNLAIDAKDEHLMLQTALSILEWGQVYRGCIDWLLTHSESKQLISAITDSSKIIDGTLPISTDNFTSLFDRGGAYRCNSGTTKIFSFCSNKSIIYDGRVACAIGMLVHDFLKENQIPFIPEDLNFLMDATQRNTSKYTGSKYSFSSKADAANALLNQAISNLKINLILQKLIQNSGASILGFSSTQDKMRAIEASMFMIGYEVNVTRFKRKGVFLT